MKLNVLFSASPDRWTAYHQALKDAFASKDLDVRLERVMKPEDVDYIVFAPNGPVSDFSLYPNLKAVLGLWAGVETIVGNPTLTVPMTRMVDSGLQEGMVEWVTGNVLRYHLGMDRVLKLQDGIWDPVIPPLARDRNVGILGLGSLGSACAKALAALNFNVAGWSGSAKDIENVKCLHGNDGLEALLAQSEIVVLLLPLTSETECILNAQRLALLPKGAQIINPGRGALLDDAALLDALDTGQVSHATLDVFRVEPLPPEHPFWAHPNVTVTPHIASETRADTAAEVIAENIALHQAGRPMRAVVNRHAGY